MTHMCTYTYIYIYNIMIVHYIIIVLYINKLHKLSNYYNCHTPPKYGIIAQQVCVATCFSSLHLIG